MNRSFTPALVPVYPDAATMDTIETLIIPRARDLGSFAVCRARP